MIISRYFVGFVLFSFFGWIWECLYCMSKSGKWENRGFLFGPYCPIYGLGVMSAYFVFQQGIFPFDSHTHPLLIFLICMGGSAILEYVTSYILEKKYHARWWDYSKVPLNINGRIALPISVAFGLAGLLLVKYVLPVFTFLKPYYPSMVMELLSLVLMGLLGTDLGMTLASLSKIVERLNEIEEQFGNKVQFAYDRIGEGKEELLEQVDSGTEEIKNYMLLVSSYFSDKELRILHHIKKFKTPNRKYIAEKLQSLRKGDSR